MPLGKLKKKQSLYLCKIFIRSVSNGKWIEMKHIKTHCKTNCSKTKTISEEEVDDQRFINSKKHHKNIKLMKCKQLRDLNVNCCH